ncbi:MAG: outer membrane lipoprotein chaperone LolA [Bacteroidota bacterium]
MRIARVFGLAILWLTPMAAQPQPELSIVTVGMQKRYAEMQNAVARFTQEVRFGFSNIRQEFKGTLTMKKPTRFRIESEHQVLVTDGSTVWAYSPVNKQVVVDHYKENRNTISPDRFLVSIPDTYYATVLGTEPGGKARLVTLKLVPKDDTSFIRSVKLTVEEGVWIVKRITVEDINETTTTYTIEEITFNSTIDDKAFVFTPPPGTDIVDLR